jgi:hypothetical protein
MTVTLELTPDIEGTLAAQAHARGAPLDTYLRSVIEDLACQDPARPANAGDIRAMLDQLAEIGRDLPRLPSSAFSRESIYQNHD